jgi:hypothetical protein
MTRFSRVIGAALLVGVAGTVAAERGGRGFNELPLLLARDGGRHSLDEVVSGARRDHPGKVLSADTVEEGGRPVYRIRILNDEGRVRGLRYDGNTGRPLPRPDRSPRRPPR